MRNLCLIGCVVFFSTISIVESFAKSAYLKFQGYVPPFKSAKASTTNHRNIVVSFSDQVILEVPVSFSSAKNIRAFDKNRRAVAISNMLYLGTSHGAVVNLSSKTRQTFLICNGKHCIRYRVLRHQ